MSKNVFCLSVQCSLYNKFITSRTILFTEASLNILVHDVINLLYHKNWYENKPEPVVETESATILWDFAIRTDRKINANKPDITIKDHKNNSCLLVELMFPMDKNLSSGEFGKISKYEDLEIEIAIEQIWYLKPTLIPLVMGALVTVKNVQMKFTTNPWKAKSN